MLTGIVVVFSASSYMATIKIGDPYYYFKKQIIGAVGGAVCMWFLSRFDYHLYPKLKWIILGVPVVMLLLVRFVPVSYTHLDPGAGVHLGGRHGPGGRGSLL